MAYQAGVSFSSRFASMIPVAGSALLGFWTRTCPSGGVGELYLDLWIQPATAAWLSAIEPF